MDLAPIHYADTLIRADLGISGFGLELNMGYWPDGTLPRDVLEINRIIDRWSSLGLPLVIIITIPGVTDTAAAAGNAPLDRMIPFGSASPDSLTQAKLALDTIRACLAKPSVQGVIWNQLNDGDTTNYPCGGLLTDDGQSKPVLEALREIRTKYVT